METNTKIRISEIIFLLLISLNILDFFNILSTDMGFIKEMMSLVLMAGLFYDVGIIWLFFGTEKNEKSGIMPNWLLESGLIIFYLAFLIKDVVLIASEGNANIFSSIFLFISTYASQIELISFYIGGIGLLLLSFYLAFFGNIQERSLLSNLHVGGRNFLVRFLGIFLLLNAFYILVFDLVFEWLAVATDNTLIVVALLVYMVFIVRQHKKFSADTMIYKIGSFSENFYEHCLKFFHDKDHVFLGISGLLVLHLITEISNFLFPYVFNFTSSMYFEKLGHESIYSLFVKDIASSNIVYVSAAYLFNIFAIFALFLFAAFIWYELYKQQKEGLPRWITALFFASIPSFILIPLFKFGAISAAKIEETGLVGVDIISQGITNSSLNWIVICSVVFGIVIFLISYFEIIKKLQYHIIIISTLMFMFFYLFLFYSSTTEYYYALFQYLAENGMWFFMFYFGIFYVIKIAFIVFGIIKFVVQIVKNHLL